MKVTLHLEIRGHIDRSEEVDYVRRQEVADGWYRMFPGKEVKVYYTLESKMNYESDREQTANGGRNDRKEISPAAPMSKY